MFTLSTSIILGTIGQLLLKHSSTIQNDFHWPLNLINFPFFLAGTCYFLSLLFYTSALKDIPLSVAYPSISISYVLVAISSHYIWGTPLGVAEFFAFFLIISGIAILFYAAT